MEGLRNPRVTFSFFDAPSRNLYRRRKAFLSLPYMVHAILCKKPCVPLGENGYYSALEGHIQSFRRLPGGTAAGPASDANRIVQMSHEELADHIDADTRSVLHRVQRVWEEHTRDFISSERERAVALREGMENEAPQDLRHKRGNRRGNIELGEQSIEEMGTGARRGNERESIALGEGEADVEEGADGRINNGRRSIELGKHDEEEMARADTGVELAKGKELGEKYGAEMEEALTRLVPVFMIRD
jgi:hypothetical protein